MAEMRKPMTAYEGSIYQINSSRGGVPKLPMVSARVTREGIVGDYQNDTRNHGGPMRALCLYTLEQIKRLQAEGHSIFPGAAGENITLVGIPQALLVPGARLELGDEVIAELTSYTIPCSNLVDCFNDGDFTRIPARAASMRASCRKARFAGGIVCGCFRLRWPADLSRPKQRHWQTGGRAREFAQPRCVSRAHYSG